MVRSGELMKYPLATISRLMDLFPDNFLYGYDIHCAFTKTLNHSTLGPAVRARRIGGIVPSFHGHAHNRMCEVQHHPKYKHSAGKEDFEMCEQTFSDSNVLASEIRNATDFHRHQALEEHFKFADFDQYASLGWYSVRSVLNHFSNLLFRPGTFLYNNYVQCLEIINAQQTIPRSADLANVDFEAELRDEYNYLVNAHCKQDDDSIYLDYIKALNKLDDAKITWRDALSQFRKLNDRTIQDSFVGKEIADLRRRHTNTHKRLELKLDNIESLEARLGIEARWGATHPKHLKYQECLAHWRFFKATQEVEKLVVMQLLELTKLQMSNLGYKLRTHISKTLKTRATAICNAIDRYNKYAAELNPPPLPTPPMGTDSANLHFDAERAKEELTRCNVEIARLRTKIWNDSLEYPKVIQDLKNKDPFLARQIETLDGYTGAKVPGWQMEFELEGQGDVDAQSTKLADDRLLDDRVDEEESALADFLGSLHITDA
ncbi:hypothetical protein J3R83DRAFT_8602 [Lanmaoa asiatica]|nr:hypothetical protein J3R83DRAFT_8602 [Lanmaoa asiatica]